MFQDITITELLELLKKGEAVLIDVRSPSEYTDATIPGSLNIPLFDDEERAEVGTIYKQVSVQAAKDKGLELVSRKLPAFIKTFERLEPKHKVVFCWRGGMRSRTSATVTALMGLRMYRLSGGYRAYRKWVVEKLGSFESVPPCYVINGYTGTGKTLMLQKLAERGYPVIDLEAMAQHRGSIFGQIGKTPHNQKTFESLLVHSLQELQNAPFILLEAESKRVGKVVLPEFLVDAKESGTVLFVEMPVKERIRHILEDYRPEEHQEECLQAFEHIEKRIHTPIASDIHSHLEAGRFAEAVELLLEHYYDPRYEHATQTYEKDRIMIEASNVDDAVEKIAAMLPPLRRP